MCNFVRGFRRAYKWRAYKWRAYNGGLIDGRLINGGSYKHNVYLTGFKLTRTEKAQTIVALIKTCIALLN